VSVFSVDFLTLFVFVMVFVSAFVCSIWISVNSPYIYNCNYTDLDDAFECVSEDPYFMVGYTIVFLVVSLSIIMVIQSIIWESLVFIVADIAFTLSIFLTLWFYMDIVLLIILVLAIDTPLTYLMIKWLEEV